MLAISAMQAHWPRRPLTVRALHSALMGNYGPVRSATGIPGRMLHRRFQRDLWRIGAGHTVHFAIFFSPMHSAMSATYTLRPFLHTVACAVANPSHLPCALVLPGTPSRANFERIVPECAAALHRQCFQQHGNFLINGQQKRLLKVHTPSSRVPRIYGNLNVWLRL